MSNLKQFLHDLTKDGVYHTETVDHVAEIYIVGDTSPAVLLELNDNVYHVNVRCDIPPRLVAELIHDMTMIDEDITFGPDFFISEKGILYGQDATATFFATIFKTMEEVKLRQEHKLDDVIFVVEEPIYGYGSEPDYKYNKLQKLWGTDSE